MTGCLGIAISSKDWSIRFTSGGGERILKYQAGEVGRSQIIEGLKVLTKKFRLCSIANGKSSKAFKQGGTSSYMTHTLILYFHK